MGPRHAHCANGQKCRYRAVRPSAAHAEELPGARYTLEFVLTHALEAQVRSGNQVDDCPGHENLAWLGSTLDTLSQMHGYSRYVFAAAFDFTRVEACSNLHAQLL